MKKYTAGDEIKSIDEMMQQEFIYLLGKVYHIGWFSSWPLRNANYHIHRGQIRKAVKIESEGK